METEKIKNITEPILTLHDLFLVDLKISKDNVIEIFVDSLNGVNLQTCIEISREIEQHLDREAEDFELTVSSAGIGYPFKVEGQYRKNTGKTVEVQLNDHTRLTGILKAFSDQDILLECEEKKAVEGKKKKQTVVIEKTILRSDIRQIKDVVTF